VHCELSVCSGFIGGLFAQFLILLPEFPAMSRLLQKLSLFVNVLKKHAILLSKSQLLTVKTKKAAASDSFIRDYSPAGKAKITIFVSQTDRSDVH
jgi:hypothetical protein